MNDQILMTLKRKLDDLAPYGQIDIEAQRNALKEELQFFVLNFVYHHPVYGTWTMYGGSALRICHGLDRMSVDLDFEIDNPVTDAFLEGLKGELEAHFVNTYGTDSDFLAIKITNGRGLILKFHIGEELGIGHPSKQVHVKIDLNHFNAPKTVKERRPINRDQLSFAIKTYNMSALMASKIAAIFLRGQRGVGAVIYEEKGRDIYDLLWYMSKKVIPDLDYLTAKGVDAKDPRSLFDRLTVKMSDVSDENLKQDLSPLFPDQRFVANWLTNWRTSYFGLLEAYEIRTLTELERLTIHQDIRTDVYYFVFYYKTVEKGVVRIMYRLSDYWIDFGEGELPVSQDEHLNKITEISQVGGWSSRIPPEDKVRKYAALFHRKTEDYLKKTNRIVLGETIDTKLIRMTADQLNQKEQILLNKSALLSCELDDLLK